MSLSEAIRLLCDEDDGMLTVVVSTGADASPQPATREWPPAAADDDACMLRFMYITAAAADAAACFDVWYWCVNRGGVAPGVVAAAEKVDVVEVDADRVLFVAVA